MSINRLTIRRSTIIRLFAKKPDDDGFDRFKRGQTNNEAAKKEMHKSDIKLEEGEAKDEQPKEKKAEVKNHDTIEELRKEIEEQFKESQRKIEESSEKIKKNDENEQSPKDYDFWKKKGAEKENEKKEEEKKKEPILNWFRSKKNAGRRTYYTRI